MNITIVRNVYFCFTLNNSIAFLLPLFTFLHFLLNFTFNSISFEI